MEYEINVALNGRHYFATHPRSGRIGEKAAKEMARDFERRFPASEGFTINLSLYSTTGRVVSFSEDTQDD